MTAISAKSLVELLGDDDEQSHWLILEETGQTLPALYSLSPAPDYEWLFLHTPYAGLLKRSPLVLRLDTVAREIRQAFENDPRQGDFSGIVVSSHHPHDAVLAHLRRCLEVRFYGNRRAMLRYYYPAIAACLFAPDSKPHRQWLGPLDQWVWFGTTTQRLDEQPQWHALRDDTDTQAIASDESSRPITLSNGQENALEQHIRTSQATERTTHYHYHREGSLT
ncbi:protein of unknown function [Modicisalibacter muralis]|uniref:DUF4123 domain-containing protein n=1 Tax=Modicisalibacter muralis TaxID=119000 RepID=A0A1G9R152_9GAMM|nr:DUF4123 domain-containing protein [Halomonas muralis]SDM16978.1 protein of unknown function [Halomonas muralis]